MGIEPFYSSRIMTVFRAIIVPDCAGGEEKMVEKI